MKLYYISTLVLGVIFIIAYFIHFIKLETFGLLLCSYIITQFCLYFDKEKKTPENTLKQYVVMAHIIMFFAFILWTLFYLK